MSEVAKHYGSEGIVGRILAAVGKADGQLAAHHFYPFDQLHGGELLATKEHTARLEAAPSSRVLDIGSGIGGPARYIASTYGAHVDGVDLTPDFVAASTELAKLCGLQAAVTFVEADATDLPFGDQTFDSAICFYVGMNLPDKLAVLREARRVIKSTGKMIWTEVVRAVGEPHYPLPWARSSADSHLVDRLELLHMFDAAGFEVVVQMDEAAAHIELARRRAEAGPAPSPLQHVANEVVLGSDFVERRRSYIRNLAAGRLSALMIEARPSDGR